MKDTVFDRLPKIDEKWINIGRLDVMTSGLILFTNDGNLAHRLTHPSSNIKRTYLAKISNEISKHAKNLSISGVDIGRGQIGRFSEFTKYKKRTEFMKFHSIQEKIVKSGEFFLPYNTRYNL